MKHNKIKEGLTNFVSSLAIDDVEQDKLLMDLHYGFVGKNLEDIIATCDDEEEIKRKEKIKPSLNENFIPTQQQIEALKETIYNVLNDGVPYGYAQMIKNLLFCIREYGSDKDLKIEKLWERTEKEDPKQFIQWLSYKEIDTLVENSLKVIDALYAHLKDTTSA